MCGNEHKPYTADEDEYIKANYNSMSTRDIALHLKRSVKAIQSRANKKLYLVKASGVSTGVEEEDEAILNRGENTLTDVARKLGKSTAWVSVRAKQLGCPFKKERGEYISNGYCCIDEYNGKKRKKTYCHIRVMEEILGRKLQNGEYIHHIDGNRQNNSPDNLYLFHANGEHSRAHWSVNRLLPDLVRNGYIYFDRKEGVYKICE